MKAVKYGLIGTGAMGHGHLECLNNMEAAEVVAAADPNEESLDNCRKNNANKNCKYFADYKELLERNEVEAVVVATPDYTHVDIVADALRAGKHVLSEKPAATNYEDLDRLEAEVAKASTVYQVGLEMRYVPSLAKTKKMLAEGVIGRVQMLWCLEFRGPFMKKVGDWIIRRRYTGGAWVEKMCHYFDLVTWFAGSAPKKVASFSGQDIVMEVHGAEQDVADNGWTIVEYANSARAALGMGMFTNVDVLEVSALGTTGRMTAKINSVEIWDGSARSHTTIDASPDPETRKYSHNGGVYLEHLAFIDCIRNGRRPLTDIDAARTSTLVGLAAEESFAKGGVAVKID